MIYEIEITSSAQRDMNGVVDYIEQVLLNPQAADDLLDEAETAINSLAQFPEKYSLVDDSVLKAWGIRYTSINNYLAFYIVSERERKVYIVRFLYKKRNWVSILKQGFFLK